MTQESHQMGLDTRVNATPVTDDTGDTGVTPPAQPEWGGNGRGPLLFHGHQSSSHSQTGTKSPPVLGVSMKGPAAG